MTDLSPEAAPPPRLPQRRPMPQGPGSEAAGSGLPQRRPMPQGPGPAPAGSGLPQRRPAGPDPGAPLPRRTSAVRRVGRHRSPHRLSVASDAPALVIAVPGAGAGAVAELADRIAEAASQSCPGVGIKIGYLGGNTDLLADVLAAAPAPDSENAPHAVVVPLLAGPHPTFDPMIADVVSRTPVPAMLAASLGPHPLLAGALHDRLSEVGLARASRARGLNIASGANGVIVVADRGPQAISDAGVTTVLLAARLAIPALPASLGDHASVSAALQRLREAGASHPAIAPCVIGPETDPAEFARLGKALSAPCAAPLGSHPAIAQLVAVRYGEALARITVPSH